MKKEILERLIVLGADVSLLKADSLERDLQNIRFQNFLFDEDYLDVGYQFIDEFLELNNELYRSDIELFYTRLTDHLWNYRKDTLPEETYLGQIYYKGETLLPYDKTTDDFEEWNDWFTNNADLSEVRAVVGDVEELSFVNIFGSHGFPDDYFVCLQDPNPDNPTVFGTDHEVFFIEIENYGTLEEFLNTLLTKAELREQIKEYIEQMRSED